MCFYFFLWFSAPVRDWILAESYEKLKIKEDEMAGGDLEDTTKITENVDWTFRWRYYLKLNHVNTYNYLYGKPETEHDKKYSAMCDYYHSLVKDFTYYLSLRCN